GFSCRCLLDSPLQHSTALYSTNYAGNWLSRSFGFHQLLCFHFSRILVPTFPELQFRPLLSPSSLRYPHRPVFIPLNNKRYHYRDHLRSSVSATCGLLEGSIGQVV